MRRHIMNQAPLCLLLLSNLRGFARAQIIEDEPSFTASTPSSSSLSAQDYNWYDDLNAVTFQPQDTDPIDNPNRRDVLPNFGESLVDNEQAEALSISNEILKNENSVIKVKVDRLSGSFKKNVEKIKFKHKRVDIVFLIDASSSVGKTNFISEIKFVKKLLSDFNVSFNYTRVAVITFSSRKKIFRHIDQISQSVEDNDKCLLLNYQIPKIKYSGGGTYTYGALKEAEDIFKVARVESKKIIFLITDGFSNGPDPVPLAVKLKRKNVVIYSIGIQSGNLAELYNISSAPGENHSYLLDSFNHFETLARKALHSDYKSGENIAVNSNLCDVLCLDDPDFLRNDTSCCDRNATCVCSTNSGHYLCLCKPGFIGSGRNGACLPCPNGTFWDGQSQCRNCPDVNHVTQTLPAMSADDCVCKSGYKAEDGRRCEVITCPELTPPENGYFVKHPNACGQVLNAACGTRCQSGYQLVGDSIRLCQESGVWSGNDPKCVLKTCPPLKIPYYGLAVCKNPDLNLYFDYSPRNKSFITNYSISVDRLTEPMPIDTDCTFKCGHGFYLVGSSSRNCLPLSKWDGLQASCKQILCSPLPKIPFGEYDPTDCAEQKSAHGSNCTLICNFGFELKGGPSTKSCGGKRNGAWTQKSKTPRCVDVTPPHLMCPNNYTLQMHDDYNYAVVKRLNQPYAFDNGGDNFTFWAKPAVREQGTKLFSGTHLFTYVAVDSFKNKAKCNFTVTIVDKTAPVFENCYDPPAFYITTSTNKNETLIEWDEPTVFDNSNENITMTSNMRFGYHDVGNYQIVYQAKDSSDNVAECTLNITVKEYKCDNLPSPLNGQTVCAKNSSHTWCEISCDIEYTLYDQENDSLTLFCKNRHSKWENDTVPECTPIEKPVAVEEVITISLGSELGPLCEHTNEIQTIFTENMKNHLCGEQIDCTITTEMPTCEDVEEPDEKSKYHIVKREISTEQKSKSRKHLGKRDERTIMKINVYTKLSKRLGMWKYDGKKSDNIKRVKAELQNINENERLRKQLSALNIDLSVLKLDETIRCPNGSVAKKLICVQCPRGTYHNHTSNGCISCPIGTFTNVTGKSECVHCPLHHSTRKPNSKHSTECKPQCPPGTMAKLKPMKHEKMPKYHKSLMPFCRKCEPGEYQGLYNRINCEKCPPGYTSSRGSTVITDCVPKHAQPCMSEAHICGSHGRCSPDPINDYLYSCTCDDGYAGEHCEKQLDICASAPCYNGGTCLSINATIHKCLCPPLFSGENCENFLDPCHAGFCHNGGICVESDGRSICECPPAFEGERCHIRTNYCLPNPCENEGVCFNDEESFNCSCPPGRMGKRCHLKPCDYMPCPRNAICVDIGLTNANRESYQCVCPRGLKGVNCTELDNPCDREPCRNNGHCVPVKLRDLTAAISHHAEVDNDEIYSEVLCQCPPYFYGSFCEILITPDFVMSFEKSGTNDYVKIAGPGHNISEISMCTWIQTNDDFNYGSVISYATSRSDNAFTFTDYSGFVLYISGEHVVTNVFINDGHWHFICLSWISQMGLYEIYLDGELHTTGYGLSSGKAIEGNGLFVIGQEQDSLGGDFSESESFVGRLSYLDLWSRALSGFEFQQLYYTCQPYQGDMIRWTDLKTKIVGTVKIQRSEFCQPCERNLTLQNGRIDYHENHAYLNCDEGYQLQGPSEIMCLRTSRWSNKTRSYCQLIRCEPLNSILNGRVIVSKTSYNGIARFVCDAGFNLSGVDSIRCTVHGNWSYALPECISTIKCPALPMASGYNITYASERGVINGTHNNYAIDTLAEVQCDDEYYIEGENLLTCLETGKWDFVIPNCTLKKTHELTTELSNVTYPAKGSNIIRINRRPDVRFWKQLKDYLFYGCNPIDPTKQSPFCKKTAASSTTFTDLSLLDFSLSKDYQNMDIMLLERLEKSSNAEPNLKLQNLLDYILYNKIDPTPPPQRLPGETEDYYRFVICLYIDIIMMDREVTFDDEILLDINSRENTNDKIKSLLKHVVQPIYETHLREQEEEHLREIENQRNALRKIVALAEAERMLAHKCPLNMVPDPPNDSRIISIEKGSAGNIASDMTIEKLRMNSESLEVGSQIRYECNTGFLMKGIGYIECLKGGKWSHSNSFCEGVVCERPPLPEGMFIANESMISLYYHDTKIEYRCLEGYIMQGHPIITCSTNGKWSSVTARCTKISCGKPNISHAAKILAGISFQYGDRLRILCENKHTIEIICHANGEWTRFAKC
ncbi:sushi, von Willebrand factor type A, EGF and pentraxin domain-containing protein 1-like [Toxorhynchites rutilus septentrionalis]|uniref:sushi, von Willebrand factor type A, EGF and pentraxin domain-containing protein 1-like n=1 Tax=Toxorhynchites rutilus septentrionalis TaxID=329112 RepID=UPI002478C48F|nr:sushi, von Willebrand factor type A, EGF and pentraxin domain-containing protein 1-like [Toxorhynchites rutilus septentrionalis]XP_055618199.1 sushi, von Willebrand factor type A, EGF and pentraxin domain-containing protein 1-like [Toxorhynchites rutilus septentrionalis]XP_055618200.1 sushi, von Willebrand factor type A, EGF and pentraxin domain-containing protein 1-like [Toxorhynchites rutilus septentrionalis]XP_055618201.1 sushi, von Willebrand factor type A, EGF and pentraxin domain-contai